MFNLVVPNEVVVLGKDFHSAQETKAFLTGLQDMQDFESAYGKALADG